jgi:hypothetical protein
MWYVEALPKICNTGDRTFYDAIKFTGESGGSTKILNFFANRLFFLYLYNFLPINSESSHWERSNFTEDCLSDLELR